MDPKGSLGSSFTLKMQEEKRIISTIDLENEIMKYIPKLFFNFKIEVPKQLIKKIEREIAPRLMFVKVVERKS